VLALVLHLSAARADPFTGGTAATSDTQAQQVPGFLQQIGAVFISVQRDVNRALSRQLAAIKRGQSHLPLLFGMLIAFGYGAFHAAGPGHGKTVVLSYFLSRDAHFGRGVWMGGQIALFHVVSAIVIVSALHFVLQRTLSTPVDQLQILKVVSYGGILAVGLVMLVASVRRLLGHAHEGHEHHHHHGCSHGASLAQGGLLSLAVGLIPCSGAVLVLLYALANDIVFSGVLMTLSIAAGMAVTLALIGFGAIYARRRAVSRQSERPPGRLQRVLSTSLGILGPLLISALGAVLFVGAL
jgi:ABC-type nickel/cobalt efflux system permease component RcnA